jgi:hypothetical protein
VTGADLLARTVRDGDCLIWTGAVQSRGYGSVGIGGGRTGLAHRVSYELNVGPIPPGLQIDHVKDRGCHSRRCINPAHLEPVTPRENVNRTGHGRQTHCKRGHPLSGRNLVLKPQRDGAVYRNCRICRDAYKRDWDVAHAQRAAGIRAA